MPYCTSCGSEIPAGSRFCTSCGAPVEAPEQPVNVQPPAEQPVQQPYVQPQSYVQPDAGYQQPDAGYQQPGGGYQQPGGYQQAQPYGQAGYQQYVAPIPTGGLLAWAIITLLLCTIPGIVATVKVSGINKSYTVEEQQKKLKSAKVWCIVATVLGVLALVYTVLTRAS